MDARCLSILLVKATKMTEYRRLFIPGGSYFFTVVTYQRRPVFNEPRHVDLLREAFKHIMESKPFTIDAIVILPDHLHCLWQLPENDDDFSGRWREIKKYVSKRIGADGKRPKEKDIWQRRFWEHAIRDEIDWRRHVDYIPLQPRQARLGRMPSAMDIFVIPKSLSSGLVRQPLG